MGGYGAILLAEKYPHLIGAVAAISPAIWTSYAQAESANPGAYASAADFAQDDAVTHAAALAKTPVRVAAGTDDPFYPGVQALARALPKSAEVDFGAAATRTPSSAHRSPRRSRSSPATWPHANRAPRLEGNDCPGTPPLRPPGSRSLPLPDEVGLIRSGDCFCG